MSSIAENEKLVMAAGAGTAREGESVFTDLVMEGLDVQFSPSLQEKAEGEANARALAYRDRILGVVGRSKEKAR